MGNYTPMAQLSSSFRRLLRSSLFTATVLLTWAVPNLHGETFVACFEGQASISDSGPTIALCGPNAVALNGGSAYENATAEAHYVSLQVQAVADNGAGYPAVNGTTGLRAWAWAGFEDTFTVTSATPYNGSITFSMALDSTWHSGCYSAPDTAPGSCQLSGNFNYLSLSSSWGQAAGRTSAVQSETLPQGASTFTLSNPFFDYQWVKSESGNSYILSDDLDVAMSANVECMINSNWCVADYANYLDSARMTGVVIDDATGNPIKGVSLTSDSGTDYNNIPADVVAPEPAEAPVILGIVMLMSGAAFTRRPRRVQRASSGS